MTILLLALSIGLCHIVPLLRLLVQDIQLSVANFKQRFRTFWPRVPCSAENGEPDLCNFLSYQLKKVHMAETS